MRAAWTLLDEGTWRGRGSITLAFVDTRLFTRDDVGVPSVFLYFYTSFLVGEDLFILHVPVPYLSCVVNVRHCIHETAKPAHRAQGYVLVESGFKHPARGSSILDSHS